MSLYQHSVKYSQTPWTICLWNVGILSVHSCGCSMYHSSREWGYGNGIMQVFLLWCVQPYYFQCDLEVHHFIFFSSFLKNWFEREREREKQKHRCAQEISIICLSHIPKWGFGSQPRHEPWLGSELVDFGSQDGAQSTEPHQPVLFLVFNWVWERERNIDWLFHSFMHSLVVSCMCPDWRLNPKP